MTIWVKMWLNKIQKLNYECIILCPAKQFLAQILVGELSDIYFRTLEVKDNIKVI